MKNIVIGTAGHVDHGKTWLTKALTGTDTDRLAEEKRRGITIENGFAELVHGDYDISFIDVPGHEKFISNMLAGIGGIDMVLLTVGLDEGVMPQTIEHFQILNMLGVKDGIIVLTKDDAVEDEDWKQLIEEDVRSMVKGSFLENAPMIRVSALTGYNIEELKGLIIDRLDKTYNTIKRKMQPYLYRLPVDRVFTITGFGTVVTGTSLQGSVSAEDRLTLYPEGLPVKVRNIQVHNEAANTAYAGQRTAINTANLKKTDISRGDVIAADGSLEVSMLLDVSIELFQGTKRKVEDGTRLHFFCGSKAAVCKVVLLDCDELTEGKKGFAQLHMEEPVNVKKGDRYIIRFYSPLESIGGGEILDACPKKHKRYDKKIIEATETKLNGSIDDITEITVKELSSEAVTIRRLACKLCEDEEEQRASIKRLESSGILINTGNDIYIHREYYEKIQSSCTAVMEEFHRGNPYAKGITAEELKSRIKHGMRMTEMKVTDTIIEKLMADDLIEMDSGYVRKKGFAVTYPDDFRDIMNQLENKISDCEGGISKLDDLLDTGMNQKQQTAAISALVNEGRIRRLDAQYYIFSPDYEKHLAKLKTFIGANGSITLAQFRDLIGVSRKPALALLESFDNNRITVKSGEARIIV